MTLFKQILIIISIFVTLLLASIMIRNFNSSNEFIQEQLYSSANDTATSLGLSISSANESASIEVMINAIFDSGYYESINYTDTNGTIVYERHQDITVKDIPAWFVQYVNLKSAEASSAMTKNWMPYGEVHVRSNNGHAYYQLWQTLIGIFQTFIFLTFIALGSIFVLLKIVLRPLKTVRKQAEFVMENHFFIADKIPYTTEFRDVVLGMNTLVGKIKELFENEAKIARLNHELLYKDTLTGLKNREFFNLKLKNYLEADERFSYGFLMLINFDKLKEVANTFGHEASNNLLQSISSVILETTSENPYHIGCRIRDNEFAIILPSLTEEEALNYAQKICLLFKNHSDTIFLKASDCHLNIALTPYYPHENIKELLSRSDHTLMVSLSKQNSNIEIYHNEDKKYHLIMGHNEWAKEIKAAINEHRFIYALQPVLNSNTQILHHELLLRLNRHDKIVNANYFMPVILHFRWMEKIDKYVISNLASCKEKGPVSINISLSFIQKNTNLKWLKEQLRILSAQGRNHICFEISNNSVMQDTGSCIEFANMLRTFGLHLGIDHFMIKSENLNYLQDIRPKYLKLNAHYLISFLKGSSKELPNRSLLNIANMLNIKVIAIGVDSEEIKEHLQNLGIRYFQGSHIAKTQIQKL